MFTLTFSHKVNGIRVPFVLDGKEVTLTVDADTKTSAIYHPDTVAFCYDHQGISVRTVR